MMLYDLSDNHDYESIMCWNAYIILFYCSWFLDELTSGMLYTEIITSYREIK